MLNKYMKSKSKSLYLLFINPFGIEFAIYILTKFYQYDNFTNCYAFDAY